MNICKIEIKNEIDIEETVIKREPCEDNSADNFSGYISVPVKFLSINDPYYALPPPDENILVIKETLRKHKHICYKGYTYKPKGRTNNFWRYDCSYPKCQGRLNLSLVHQTGPNTKMIKMILDHTCDSNIWADYVFHPQTFSEPIITIESLFQPVKVINYLNFGADFSKIHKKYKMPFPLPNDETRMVLFYNEFRQKRLFYMGHTYVKSMKRKKDYFLHNCDQPGSCEGKLKTTLQEDAVALEGKHTCGVSNSIRDTICYDSRIGEIDNDDTTIGSWIPVTYKNELVRKTPGIDPLHENSVIKLIYEGKVVLYYKGYKYIYNLNKDYEYICTHYDSENVYYCTELPQGCSGAIKLNKDKTALAELIAHTCRCPIRTEHTYCADPTTLQETSVANVKLPQLNQSDDETLIPHYAMLVEVDVEGTLVVHCEVDNEIL